MVRIFVLIFLLKIYFYLCIHKRVYALCTTYLDGPEEAVYSPGAGVTGSYLLIARWVWHPNLGPLEE